MYGYTHIHTHTLTHAHRHITVAKGVWHIFTVIPHNLNSPILCHLIYPSETPSEKTQSDIVAFHGGKSKQKMMQWKEIGDSVGECS